MATPDRRDPGRLSSVRNAARLLKEFSGVDKQLGLSMYELGAVVTAHVDLHEAAMPALVSLRQRTGETVQVAVLDGLEAVYVERLDSLHTLRIFSRVGHRLPAHATSSGKVLLAGLPAQTLEARLSQ